jgi:phosphoribulokinase
MSERHPIIAITGSSGAGTTSVTRTFENIFRREKVNAAIVEGDSFHRYDREEMKARQAEAEHAGDRHFSHFGPENNLFAELAQLFAATAKRGRVCAASTCTTPTKPRRTARSPAPSRHGRTCPRAPSSCSTKACTERWSRRR